MIYSILATIFIALAVFILAISYIPKAEHLDIAKRLGTARPDAAKQLSKISASIMTFLEYRISKIKGAGIENLRGNVKKMLDMAGNPAGVTVDGFFAITLMAMFVMTVVTFMFLQKLNIAMKVLIGCGLGFGFTYMWLKGLITNRHRSIIRTLPDVLDLIILSMEAGIDFNAAISKVTAKSDVTPLIEELLLMQQGIRLGQSRVAALEDMTKRINNPDFTAVITNIIQAEKVSSPLGPVLRVQAEQMRLKRFQLAERLAHQAPIKMLFPLIFCILPSIFLMLFAPLALRVFFQGSPW